MIVYRTAKDRNLCDLCKRWCEIPECLIDGEFEFGDGCGRANIYQCANFISNGTSIEKLEMVEVVE